ncbi:DsbA family protein [Duffyella gerundensis]|uniref:DsbA family protein n=1 Tax=Duffyella TaxID=3026546 RepID=UPI003F6DDDE0
MINKSLLLSLMFLALPALAAQPFTPEQEARIRELIRETLVQNPSILAEAADAFDKQATREQQDVVAQMVAKNHEALFNDAGSPRIGAAKPTLTLVYFTDYNCVFCKKFEAEIDKILKAYPQVAVVLKPLPYRAESSLTSARLALTVWEQQPGNFLKLHERLMSKKGNHDEASIEAALKKTGIKLQDPSKASLDTVNLNLTLAQQLGVQGTPATLVGDQLISGAVPYAQLEEAVKSALQAKP